MADFEDIYGVVFDTHTRDDVHQIKFDNISISEGYFNGVKFFPREKEIIISQNQDNVNVKDLYESVFGNSNNFLSGNLIIRVKSGVTIGSDDVETPALTIPNFGAAITTITLIVESGAFILGKGGKGGNGGYSNNAGAGAGSSGEKGGDAINTQRGLILENYGIIGSGGGGGGGAGGASMQWERGESGDYVGGSFAGGGGGAGAGYYYGDAGVNGTAKDSPSVNVGGNTAYWGGNPLRGVEVPTDNTDRMIGGLGGTIASGTFGFGKVWTSSGVAVSNTNPIRIKGGKGGDIGERGEDGSRNNFFITPNYEGKGKETEYVQLDKKGGNGLGGSAGYAVKGGQYLVKIHEGDIRGLQEQ